MVAQCVLEACAAGPSWFTSPHQLLNAMTVTDSTVSIGKAKKKKCTKYKLKNSKTQVCVCLVLNPNKPSSSGCVVSSVARFLAVRFCVWQTLAFSIACRDSQTVTCSHYSMRTLPHTLYPSPSPHSSSLSFSGTERERDKKKQVVQVSKKTPNQLYLSPRPYGQITIPHVTP